MILFTLLDLILIIVVVFSFFGEIWLISKSTWFEKRYLAKDISILTDAIYASPNDLEILYPENTFTFTVLFEKNKVTILDRKDKETLSQTGILNYFTEDENIKFIYKELNPGKATNLLKIMDTQNKKNLVPIVFTKKSDEIEPKLLVLR
ncbi:MAG: hypothetical protein V1859_06085 [archaeon]